MNKIKLLYDVVKTMKAKEVLNGMLKAEVEKDQIQVFSIQNEFEKNLSTGQTKATVNAKVDYTMPCLQKRECPELPRHMHHFHMHGREGLKEKFAKCISALSMLNALQAEEREDKTIVMSLKASDLPEDVKLLFRENMGHADMRHHQGCSLLREFHLLDKLDLVFTMFINKSNEVEKFVIAADGNYADPQTEQHDLKGRAELSFVW
jgi:hypothetical protein